MAAKKSNDSQIDKFKQAARDLECDDSETAFVRKLKKIVTAKPTGEKKSKKGRKLA